MKHNWCGEQEACNYTKCTSAENSNGLNFVDIRG